MLVKPYGIDAPFLFLLPVIVSALTGRKRATVLKAVTSRIAPICLCIVCLALELFNVFHKIVDRLIVELR